MIKKIFTKIIVMLTFVVSIGVTSVFAIDHGAYIVSTTTSYVNPATGKTADGGSNIALGEGMCRSVIGEQALLEVDNDKYYLTLRVNLMSNIKEASFEVQEGSSYRKVSASVMASSKSNDTKDYRFELPDLNSMVSPTMYIIPMERNVTFYVSIDAANAKAGNGSFIKTVEDKVTTSVVTEVPKIEVSTTNNSVNKEENVASTPTNTTTPSKKTETSKIESVSNEVTTQQKIDKTITPTSEEISKTNTDNKSSVAKTEALVAGSQSEEEAPIEDSDQETIDLVEEDGTELEERFTVVQEDDIQGIDVILIIVIGLVFAGIGGFIYIKKFKK